ncbi:MAG: hypothetical protein SF052_13480 [Bacteroidia bacterium]|nr:hypothetical protein [Bacteroidia bacterium]
MAIVLLLTCLSLNLYLTGITWFLQLIHFPLFESVGTNQFHDYHRKFFQKKQFLVLIPTILATLAAFILLWIQPWGTNMVFVKINLGMILAAQAATVILVEPIHKVLSSHGYSDKAIRHLTRVNWIPTFAWTGSSSMIILAVFNILLRHNG